MSKALVHDPAEFKLGKKRGVVDDPRTLMLASYIQPKKLLPAVPRSVTNSRNVTFAMYANDRYGDCTCAAIGNFLRAVTKDKVLLTDQDIIQAYAAITGFNPTTGANDNGAYELDVLNYWNKVGLGGHKLLAFVKLDPQKWDQLKIACWLFGGVYIGLDLPISAQRQTTWKVPVGGTSGDGAPGSWGGHAVPIEDMGVSGGKLATWGVKKAFTADFISAYCTEAYGVLVPERFMGGKSPQGFNQQQLMDDLSALRH